MTATIVIRQRVIACLMYDKGERSLDGMAAWIDLWTFRSAQQSLEDTDGSALPSLLDGGIILGSRLTFDVWGLAFDFLALNV